MREHPQGPRDTMTRGPICFLPHPGVAALQPHKGYGRLPLVADESGLAVQLFPLARREVAHGAGRATRQ